MRKLTDRQKEILLFIEGYIQENKYPPTIREISVHFSMTVRGAYDHLRALKKKGVIHTDSNRSRSIEVVAEEAPEVLRSTVVRQVPILGTVAAGVPILSQENFEGTVSLPSHYLRTSDKYFALKVRGDSMTDAGIVDGDVAIIRHQPVAKSGDIVVAMVDEAVTLKRFYKEQHRVKLQAENPKYPPIFTRDVRILGTLAHLIRNYE